MRRTLGVFCSGGPYHVPTLARVALFPIHLDPPTRQHRELFRLLLGAPDLATMSRSSQPPQHQQQQRSSLSSSSSMSPGAGQPPQSTSANSSDSTASGVRGKFQNFPQRHCGDSCQIGDKKSVNEGSSLSSVGAATPTATPLSADGVIVPSFPDEDPISCGSSSPFWYMEAFATSLREDSQLAPFDDIILIPNTRGPVSLRQSTHLAALAVLATRGLAHVHVDFTALEHPDESMPIIYELVCKYANSVLVHWLQDAYEMQNWSHFSEFKNIVPMLLLQTQSYPPRALERHRPLGSVSRLTSRQYHSPVGPYVRSPEEAEYYRNAERFIQTSSTMRRRNPSPTALTGGGYNDIGLYERYESASLVNRESDYFDDVPDVPPNQRRCATADERAATPSLLSSPSPAWHGEETEMSRGTPPPFTSGHERVLSCSPPLRGGQIGIRTASTNNNCSGGGSNTNCVQRSSSAGHDRLGLSYADCAKGRWWNTPGGRGDDEVELSRAYWSSTSSSWLGDGGTGATSALPEWMEDIDAPSTRIRHHHRFTEDHATTTNISDPSLAEEDRSVPNDSVAAVTPEGDWEGQCLDTVVSDHGFALAVDEQQANRGRSSSAIHEAAAEASGKANESSQWGLQSAACSIKGSETRSAAAARESADEDTRKRFLTHEIEDVHKMLDDMLHPAAAVVTAREREGSAAASSDHTSGGTTATSTGNRQHTFSTSSALLPKGAGDRSTSTHARNSGNRSEGSQGRTLGRSFGAYEAHHHDIHYHTRHRHRSVKQLIEELFPPRASYGPATSASAGPTAIGAAGDGLHEYYSASDPHHTKSSDSSRSSGNIRAVSSASIFNTAVKTTPTHLGLMQQGTINRGGNAGSSSMSVIGSSSSSAGGAAGSDGGHAMNSSLYSWIDSPMVEVHPITRSTGADVRQALWEQEIHPSSILTDCVQRYMEGHGLYRDPRKTTAASLYAGVGSSDFSGSARGGGGGGGGGIGGPGGQLGVAAEISGGFRDSACVGNGSVGSGGSGVPNSMVGNLIMDGRTGIRRVAPRDTSTLSFAGLIPRLELHYDRNNLLAREQFEKLRIFQCQDGEEPDLIVPIGGDGYMMHCIRKNWRRFIPFYGVNAGHVGYLLNDRSTLEELFSSPLKLHFTTMLYCQAEKEGDTGERMLLSELAFNDAWVERSSGQTALIRILVNGQERIRRLRGDGVLVSTAAGSTAYSQALGASPVPVGAPLIQVVGSNVVSPAQWRPAHLDQEDQVELEVIDSTKRPCRCYVDSVDVGNVTRLLVRSSRVAGVTLAFSKSCDLQHKLYQMQFPKTL